ncbi:syntaxin-binding protein 4-like [Physella acuta]|uniref:syntaxin-binding protein 4-like n=1 Tax=Physella acuta TaxID=109671 RepID=UPI0027DDFFDC|nr:syntaxin-binding protein 4-like [Physella acuta]XP_059178932.1 syntaxin-binding protein 4-like [Physella acuta]XP_059178933.1 syntaxin-binding protein 4-like [Physella acuta]
MSVTLTVTESQSMKDNPVNSSSSNGKNEGREADLIIFDHTTKGLGLKICGGCSTDGQEDYGIFVKRVLPGGLAESTGEIHDGDQILEVNGQLMQNVSYERAVSMLRQASASNHVEMVITRDAESRQKFSEYLNRFGPITSPYTVGDQTYGMPILDSDSEFRVKTGGQLKSNPLYLDTSEDQSDFIYSGANGDPNGHLSPTSSCASELANHMGDSSNPPFSLLTQSNGVSALKVKATPSDHLDSLLSKKLSQDPGLKMHITQLEAALTNLGLQVTPSSQSLLHQQLNIDHSGMVRFEDFVEVARSVYENDLELMKGQTTLHTLNAKSIHTPEDYASVISERDQLKAEVAALKEELKNRNLVSQNAEEQLLLIRKQAQASIEEGRSLKSKLHLAEQAQTKAQQTERDYEEVVTMLENEVAQLRLQMSKSDGVNMQKRLAVLVCQLKKAESGKKTYEVATEKLMGFVEHSLDIFGSIDNTSRTQGADGGNGGKVSKKEQLQKLSTEGREVIKVVRSLMETIPLPFGWEEAYTAEGVKYYINHLNQTTTWTHPVSCMEHQTSAKVQALPNSQGPAYQKVQKHHPAPPDPVKGAPNHQSVQNHVLPSQGTKTNTGKGSSLPPTGKHEHVRPAQVAT